MSEKTIFENIKHIDKFGNEYWNARELQKTLKYKEWRKFEGVIKKAITSCIGSNYNVDDHFVRLDKMIELAKGANLFRITQTDAKLKKIILIMMNMLILLIIISEKMLENLLKNKVIQCRKTYQRQIKV